MSTKVEQIKQGYADICRVQDAVSAYTDFHHMLEEADPTPDDIMAASRQDTTAIIVIEQLRRTKVPMPHTRMQRWMRRSATTSAVFRGSGMIILGNHDGDILGASYQPGDVDPVADRYGNYQKAALKKLGQAALLGKAGYFDPRDQYGILETVLRLQGLKPNEPTHRLGYVAYDIGNDGFMTAGASGMLASDWLAEQTRRGYAEQLKQDYDRGLVTWELDEFAGLYDTVAASTAAIVYAQYADLRNVPNVIPSVRANHEGQNLH